MERVGVNDSDINEGMVKSCAPESIFNNTETPASAQANKGEPLFDKPTVRLAVVSTSDAFKAEISELINSYPRINLCGVFDTLALLESTPGIFPHIVAVELVEESHSEMLAIIHRLDEENYPKIDFLAIVPSCNRAFLEKCFYSGVRFVIPRERLAQNFRQNIDALANRNFL